MRRVGLIALNQSGMAMMFTASKSYSVLVWRRNTSTFLTKGERGDP